MRPCLHRMIVCCLAVWIAASARAAQPATDPQAALNDAAKAGNVDVIKKLLAGGAKVNAGYGGWSALHMAGTAEVAELLIAKGAAVDATSTDLGKNAGGFTPLYTAAGGDRVKVAEVLLAHGADAARKQRCDLTALHAARSTAMISLLLEHKAGIDARDVRGATPIVSAATDEAAGALMAADADLNAADRYGRTALHHAAEAGWAQVCEWLVAKGADAHARDALGRTALHYARNKETVKSLEEYGVKGDVADVFGQKPDTKNPGLTLEKRIIKGMTGEQLMAAMDGGPAQRFAQSKAEGKVEVWWYRNSMVRVVLAEGKVVSFENVAHQPKPDAADVGTVVNDPCGK